MCYTRLIKGDNGSTIDWKKMTTRGLFIIESLERSDEESGREGVIIRQILELSESLPVRYIYIRTRQELSMALDEFKGSNFRYLHISSHGSKNSIELTLESLPFDEFAPIISPYLRGRRLFFSACSVVNRLLADSLMPRSRCNSIIGPCRDISFGDAMLMWATFYHLAFRDEDELKLVGGKIRWALRRVNYSFGQELRYYRRVNGGWKQEDIEKRWSTA
jgi:hypothetical protein